MTSEREIEYVRRMVGQLQGARIVETAASIDPDDGSVWPSFTVETPAGLVFDVQVSRDAEGNGPGHLFIMAAL